MKAKTREFKVGQQVLMKKVNRTTLDPLFEGPFEVREIKCQQNVGIFRNKKIQFVHKDLLKLYNSNEDS